MNQSINLYLPEFRKRKAWLDTQRMIALVGVSYALLFVATGIEIWLFSDRKDELAVFETQRDAAEQATRELRNSYGSQSEDKALLDDIIRLESELNGKQALLQFMEGRELGNTNGFSEYLADLSRYYTSGISLNHIVLGDGGREVRLGGEVLKAELVPQYLQALSQGASYAGKSFDALEINGVGVEIAAAQRDGVAGSSLLPTIIPVWRFTVNTATQQPAAKP